MSTFIVQDKTINQLANTISFYAEYGRHPLWSTKQACKAFVAWIDRNFSSTHGFMNEKDAYNGTKKLAEVLYATNVKAVNSRYNENTDMLYEGFKTTLPYQAPIKTIKALRCLIYQCSEGQVPQTETFKHLENIANTLANDIVTSLPEYDKEPWE